MSVLEEFGMDVFYFYTAPADFPISGRIVQEGMEIVEVITDGEVLFDYKGRMERFGRGWIFWQQAGDYTVHISVPGNPYSCIAFQLVAFQKRIVQRVSRWNDLATLDEFIRKVLSMRQAPNCRVEVLEQLFRAELMQHAYLWEQSKEAKEHPQLLTKAMDVIMDQLSKDISVEEIAIVDPKNWTGA